MGLHNCCEDFLNYCLEISPSSGSMMGGKDFMVQHLEWPHSTDGVLCRWGALSIWVTRAPTLSTPWGEGLEI